MTIDMSTTRTDLALESVQAACSGAEAGTISGVRSRERTREGYAVTDIRVEDEDGAQALGKPVGRYVTVDLGPYFRREADYFDRGVRCLAGELAALLPEGPVLAAGLAALMLPVLSWLAVLLCRRKLRAELSCPASAEKGRPAAVRLTLRRPRALPVGRVRFHLAAENTVTGETACMTLPEGESAVSGRLCGCLTLRVTGVTVWDAFSLLPVPAPCRARGQLCVMPDTFPLDMEDFQALRPRREGSVYDPGRRGTDRTETFQVRDYAPGDSLRQVHWKLSGKTGRLVVRDPARPVDHRLTVLVLRQKAPPPLADALMEAAASLCQALEGRSFRLAWNGPEGYESRTLGAQEQLAQALPELMKSPAQESDPPPWQEAGTVICLCCRVPPDLPENALVLRCSQQGGEPGVFIPEQMPQQIQQWIRSAQ